MRKLTLVLPVVLLTVACGSSPTSPTPAPTPPPVTVTSIALAGTGCSQSCQVPATLALTATATLSNGTTQNVSNQAQWSSSNAGVAEVSTSGLVTAKTAGSADITAVYQGRTGTMSVSVPPAWAQSGVGDNVFTVPTFVTRMRIDATYAGTCQNFIARISTTVGSLVNVIIGTCSVADTRSPFTGTYAVNNGGTVTITGSTGINWTFTQVR